ncbi:MAG: hypothetical protein QXI73_02420 [Thermoproteota archaeon]
MSASLTTFPASFNLAWIWEAILASSEVNGITVSSDINESVMFNSLSLRPVTLMYIAPLSNSYAVIEIILTSSETLTCLKSSRRLKF